jgi:site-specific DNA recombinase
MMKAYGYIRVSKMEEGKLSPTAQGRRISEEAERRGIELNACFFDLDVNSAHISKAGTWDSMVGIIQSGDTLIVNEFTRMGRDTLETVGRMNGLVNSGVNVVALDLPYDASSIMGELITTILAGVSTAENKQRAARIRQSKHEGMKAGRWHGGPAPFGYRYQANGSKWLTLVADEEQAAVVSEMYSLRSSGSSVSQIAARFESDRTTVARILSRRTYISELERDGEVHPLNVPALVDRGTWDRVQLIQCV